MIIGLIGKIASGKDTVSKYIKEKHGFEEIVLGDIVREIAKERGLSLDRESLLNLQKELTRKYGEDYIIKLAVKRIKEKMKEGKKDFVVNGLRREMDVKVLKDSFKDVVIVEVYCDDKIRFERIKNRGREGDPKTFSEFVKQDEEEERSFNISKVIKKYADYRITNNSTLQELYEEVDKLISKLKMKNKK